MDDQRLDLSPYTENQTEAREVWLLGQPSLQSYLDFIEEDVIDGANMPRAQLVDEWRVANDYYASLEEAEAGIADQIKLRKLKSQMLPLVEKVKADSRFQKAFDTLPTKFVMVELDKLIVSQTHVSEHHTERSAARLGGAPGPEALFNFCLPLDRDEAPVQVRKTESGRFLFWSPSSDFRFLETSLLAPEHQAGIQSFGPLGGVVGAMVGYGSNFFSAIQSENRVLLHNGYHRAYALRALGITHAPCIVQIVTRLDELKLAAGRTVNDDPAFYFKAKRPPILKDFFDPEIRRVYPVYPMSHTIEVSVNVKELKKIRNFS